MGEQAKGQHAPSETEPESASDPRTSPPMLNRRIFRFSLASILLLMIPLSFGFLWLRNYYLDHQPIKWVTYSAAELDRHLQEGRTVLVNFRAQWNLSVVMHERLALEKPRVRRWIRSHNVVPMRADGTESSPEITAALESLGQSSIPVVAIYPASSPDDPIVLVDLMTEEQVLDGLQRAEGYQKPPSSGERLQEQPAG